MDPQEPLLKPLAQLEWLLLDCLYDLGQGDAIDVSEQLQLRKLRAYDPSTTGILLARVAEKGYLAVTAERQRRGRPRHIYRPLVPREMAIRRQLQFFLESYSLKAEDIKAAIHSLQGTHREQIEALLEASSKS